LLDCLILPFTLDSRPIGAIWVVTQTTERNFDREDVRIMTSLASVTSAAFRLRSTVEELVSTQERMRFATRLHDMLNETLFAVALRLDWCLHHPVEDALPTKLAEVQRDVRAMMEQIRMLIDAQSGRSPAKMLSEKVRVLASEIRSLTGLTVDVIQEGDEAGLCDRHVEILQHVVQEALVNVAKHARATRATVTLTIGPVEAHFEIVDDGRGVPDAREDAALVPASLSHFGLRQMRDRIEAAGGAVTCGVNTPRGFRVSGSLPVS
jgi:two-component system sensor histidine kinase DesK